MKREFTAIIEKRGRWYIAYIEDLPGVNTQGRTLKEVKENLQEALQLVIETSRQLAKRDPPPERVFREKISIEV